MAALNFLNFTFLPGTGRGTSRRLVEGLAKTLRRGRMAALNFLNFTPPRG